MKIRSIGALLCSVAFALVMTTGAFAQNNNRGIGDGRPGALGVGDKKPGVISRHTGPGNSNTHQSKTKKQGTGTIRMEPVGTSLKRN